MCVPILRSIGSELTKLENMQQLYVLRDAKTVRRTSWGLNIYDRYFDKEHFETNQKLWLK